MRTFIHILFGAALATVVILVAQWQMQPQMQKDISSMQSVCSAAFDTDDGPLEDACGEMIDTVEQYGFKVMSKNGTFWAETL